MFLVFCLSLPLPAYASDTVRQEQVSAALYSASATLAAYRQSSDGATRRLRQQIDLLQAQLKQGDTTHRGQLAAMQQQFVERMASMDAAYAKEISLWRAAVTNVAATPEGLAAVERFNNGDEAAAVRILARLEKEREVSGKRNIARWGIEGHARGKISIRETIGYVEPVTGVDGDAFDAWIWLARLYREAGRMTDADQAADKAASLAMNDEQRATTANERGNTAMARGQSESALKSYGESLGVVRRIAAANPADADRSYNLAVTLRLLGDALLSTGNAKDAVPYYLEQQQILTKLIALPDPKPVYRRDLADTALRLVGPYVVLGEGTKAHESLVSAAKSAEALVSADPDSIPANALMADVKFVLGSIAVNAPEAQVDGAQLLKESADFRRKTLAFDPGNIDAMQKLLNAMNLTADAQRRAGDTAAADATLDQTLPVAAKLAEIMPYDPITQGGLIINARQRSMVFLTRGDVPKAEAAVLDLVAQCRAMAKADPTSQGAQSQLLQGLLVEALFRMAQKDNRQARRIFEEVIALSSAVEKTGAGSLVGDLLAPLERAFALLGIAGIDPSKSNIARATQAMSELGKKGPVPPSLQPLLAQAQAAVRGMPNDPK